MFSISFTDEPPDYPFDDEHIPPQSGLLVLNSTLEGFLSNLRICSQEEYEAQWRSELSSLVEGQDKAAVVVSYDGPDWENTGEVWARYREGQLVHFQNHLLFRDRLSPKWTISSASQHLRDRQVLSESGDPISEWRVPVRDIDLFLRRATGRLTSRIPSQHTL